MTEPGLFDQPVPTTLPPAALAALQEIPSEGKRAHIAAILLTVLSKKRTLEAASETLSHERLPADLVARLIHTMREVRP
jgi:hypothetical protein